ncbi:MAG: hypothetical protein KF700_10525 [Hyphomonadaceae bacterium]|nr:hypothetical protein [Hyphomonadaceae bacterium]
MSDALNDLIDRASKQAREARPQRPALIGVGGAQGAGKSYLCASYAQSRPAVAHFSLDDVYRTKANRVVLAHGVHPLLITRGPPGTHDLPLAARTIDRLASAKAGAQTPMPAFEKRADNRAPESLWPIHEGACETILVDGWCMGARASSMEPPINTLEKESDADGKWRRMTQRLLETDYNAFFSRFDAMIYLQAPSWEIVRTWRGQQEAELLGRALTPEENASLDRFVMHYERITRAMLSGHHSARWIVHLDKNRKVTRIEERK